MKEPKSYAKTYSWTIGGISVILKDTYGVEEDESTLSIYLHEKIWQTYQI